MKRCASVLDDMLDEASQDVETADLNNKAGFTHTILNVGHDWQSKWLM